MEFKLWDAVDRSKTIFDELGIDMTDGEWQYDSSIENIPDCLQAGDAFYERSIIPEGDRNALKTGNAK